MITCKYMTQSVSVYKEHHLFWGFSVNRSRYLFIHCELRSKIFTQERRKKKKSNFLDGIFPDLILIDAPSPKLRRLLNSSTLKTQDASKATHRNDVSFTATIQICTSDHRLTALHNAMGA